MAVGTHIDNAALFAVLASLADNKQSIGRQYANWCNGAPALEAAVAAAAMAQDELGHARTLYPLLENFTQAEDVPEQVEPTTRTLNYRLSVLDSDFRGWSDFVATNFLLDTALTIFFEAAQDSSYDPLKVRARKVVQEERIHFVHGEGWVRRLARAGGGVRNNLVAALQRQWDETLCWYGPADDTTMLRLYNEHVIDATPEDLRGRYLHRVMPVLSGLELDFPVVYDGVAQRWRPTEQLPWSGWDVAGRRFRQAL
jgi:phenylacetate-CoA oxygenase PaaI subunit